MTPTALQLSPRCHAMRLEYERMRDAAASTGRRERISARCRYQETHGVNMRRFAAVWAICLAVAGCAAPQLGPGRADVSVKLVAFNDLHGNLQSPGQWSLGADLPAVTAGGADYLAAYVAQRVSLNRNHVVVAAGDLVGASPLVSAAYHDEGTVQAMNLLGLEFTSVGNHEFDAGSQELLRKQSGGCAPAGTSTCLEDKSFQGAAFKYLAANVVSTSTGKTILPPYAIKTFEGVRVAFIGVVLKATPSIVLPSGVAGLAFMDEADSINALIPELQAHGVHAIVVLIHQGGVPDHAISGCPGHLDDAVNSPIVSIVSRLSDAVDLVISGHTHAVYNCRLPNSVGREIPVTQASAFGRVLTDVDLSLERRTGRVTHIEANNLLISQPEADSAASPVHPFLATEQVRAIRRLIADYSQAVAPVAKQVIGAIGAPLPSALASNGEQPAGELVVDSQMAAAAAQYGGAVISFLNSSGVRGAGFGGPNVPYPHEVTYQEAFTVRPFGNSLVTMTLSAQNIKDLLEQQFAGCEGQTGNSILQVSKGFHFEWSASAPPCAKIINATLDGAGDGAAADAIVYNGIVQQPSKRYRVVVDNFLAAGKSNFSVLLQGTDSVGGPQDIDALVAYMVARYKAPNRPYDPTDPQLREPRIVRLP